jgi:hypothetical protein
MQPTPGDVHVNRLLSNVSVAFLQDQSEFIADKVFPAVPVKKQSDRYVKYDKAEWFKGKAKIRAAGSESAGGGYTFDNSPNYFCDVYAFHKDVDDDTRANQDEAIDVDSEATEFVTRDLVLKREITWAAKYFITSTWTGSSTGRLDSDRGYPYPVALGQKEDGLPRQRRRYGRPGVGRSARPPGLPRAYQVHASRYRIEPVARFGSRLGQRVHRWRDPEHRDRRRDRRIDLPVRQRSAVRVRSPEAGSHDPVGRLYVPVVGSRRRFDAYQALPHGALGLGSYRRRNGLRPEAGRGRDGRLLQQRY